MNTTLVTAALAVLLLVGTTVGVAASFTSTSADRVDTGSTAPVYGQP